MESYFFWRFFLSWIARIFFSEIEVIGSEYIPREGPIILETIKINLSYVNLTTDGFNKCYDVQQKGHRAMNTTIAFVIIKFHPHMKYVGSMQSIVWDPMLIFSYCCRRLSFLIAKKSMKRFLIGYFARALSAIPVSRPIDASFFGPGKITICGYRVTGKDTHFNQFFPNSKLFISSENDGLTIKTVYSDTEMDLAQLLTSGNYIEDISYKIIPKQDNRDLYEGVWANLKAGGAIVVFPEGGSHDRSELLPLKAGVTIMALGAMDKFPGINVKIVPCGLNYFSGHRFRSRVIINFGDPYSIPQQLVKQYGHGAKHHACNVLLEKTDELLRSVTINAPDYESLRVIHMARRLYQPKDIPLTLDQYMHLNLLFAYGFDKFKDDHEITELHLRIMLYNTKLEMLGLKDQNIAMGDSVVSKFWFFIMTGIRFTGLILILILSGPGIILNIPVGLVAKIVAKQQAKKALAGSVVKIQGTDVMASYKLIIGLVITPILYFFYDIVVIYYSGILYGVIFLFIWPLFSWASVRVLEQGVLIWRSLKELINIQWSADKLKKLRIERTYLQNQVFNFVTKISPLDRDIYSNPISTVKQSLAARRNSKHGYVTRSEEIRINGLRINESYEDLERALMKADDW